MGKAEERLKIILAKFENSKIPISETCNLNILRNIKNPKKLRIKIILFSLFLLLVYTGFKNVNLISNSQCLIDMPQDGSKLFREPEYCEICKDVAKVDKIANVSPTTFLNKYVKLAYPVVITDGANNWTAKKLFNFNFFKELFNSLEINRNKDRSCQFFPYKTEFQTLQEVFNMREDRAMLKPGEKPWYIGWNNCNDEAGRYLKQFYDKPYFLSNMTENIALSWIFMGGPGHGAHMHILRNLHCYIANNYKPEKFHSIAGNSFWVALNVTRFQVDNVHYPSWQAQLSGKKLWRLAPPPECYYQCKEIIEVTVEPGEIIVLDTNRWYHQTIVLPGEISITIGSEFD